MAEPWNKAAHRLAARQRTGDVLVSGENVDFGSLLLSQIVLQGLALAGFERPSPIQLKAIPLGRCGLDLIVQAKSGTGKTCVFSTIALDSLILENAETQILVLAPTREIAVQIHSVITAIGMLMEGLECHVFIGGTSVHLDKARLKKCHIAVGSPGRIKQLIELGFLNTARIRLFILDEADKLLEEGSFQEQINWIYSSLPANKQMLAVSATYPESMASALTRYMRDPTFVRLNATDPGLIGLKQYYKVVNSHALTHKVFEEKVCHLLELFSKIPFNQALVFSNLHSRAQHLSDILTAKGFPAVCISGNMSQDNRLDAMAKLKQFHCRVLISTDLTSRGIDAEKVNLVINLDVPQDWETYMHRIGRAGRYGTYGLAVTYCCRGEEENMVNLIAQKCNLQLLCLPEPITADLMEDSSSWNIEVTPLKQANPSTTTESIPCETLTVSSVVPVPQSSSVVPNEKPKTTRSNVKKSSKQKQVLQLSTEKLKPKFIKKESSEEMPKKAAINHSTAHTLGNHVGCNVKNGEPVENSWKTARSEEPLLNPLPKILSLASFKRRSDLTLTFAELVDDYEAFIKSGLEKHVEIIRVYTGPGESGFPGQSEDTEMKTDEDIARPKEHNDGPVRNQNDDPIREPNHNPDKEHRDYPDREQNDSDRKRNYDAEMEENDETHSERYDKSDKAKTGDPERERNNCAWPGRSGSIANSSLLATYGSKSDLESLSSRSSSSREDSDQYMETGTRDTEEQEPQQPDVNHARGPKDSSREDNVRQGRDPKTQIGHISHGRERDSEIRSTKSNVLRDKPVKTNAKRSKSSHSKHNSSSKKSFEKEKEVSATLEHRNPGVATYDGQGYEEYWKSYYQAWQGYYSATSNPYYRNFCRRSSWMAAYHMHSVYLRELLKP